MSYQLLAFSQPCGLKWLVKLWYQHVQFIGADHDTKSERNQIIKVLGPIANLTMFFLLLLFHNYYVRFSSLNTNSVKFIKLVLASTNQSVATASV